VAKRTDGLSGLATSST